MDQNSYRRLIARRRGRMDRRMLRALLRVISVPYRLAVALRNSAYDMGLARTHSADAPVISVGNITTGGTGKTPLVVWLCRLLGEKSLKCAVLTRGYKPPKGLVSDEPAILARACPRTKVLVNADRVAAAGRAVNEFAAQVLVMDDGFQHRRLGRDLDIVAIDATRPFGYDRLLPAGLLREPKKAIRRADAVVITHYDQSTAAGIELLEKQIRRIKPDIVIAKAIHRHRCARGTGDAGYDLDELRKKRIFAFCGIGNPEAFLNRLKEHGLNVVGSRVYNDHHNYTESDFGEIRRQALSLGAEMILSTEKDWVKTAVGAGKFTDILFAYLAVELEFVDGGDRIEGLIDGILNK
ncbi:MAG: tetraacyldisaccharide 4'-kinase [Planctomycetota bacterium]|nr:MAG: tetraacyldisaccharide 4'-kinase [Planctomycetota bacterium]